MRALKWLLPPDASTDGRFADALRWYNDFAPRPTGAGDLVLEHARRKYDEQCVGYDRLDDKADALVRLSATIAALLVTAVAGWKLQPIAWALPSLFFFIIAMLLALVARNPFIRPVMPTTSQIIDGVPQTGAPKEWMAAGLFVATEELRVLTDWKGKTIERANIALCVGVVLSTGLIFTFPA